MYASGLVAKLIALWGHKEGIFQVGYPVRNNATDVMHHLTEFLDSLSRYTKYIFAQNAKMYFKILYFMSFI